MDHIFAWQLISLCYLSTTSFAPIEHFTFGQEFRAGGTMNAAIYAATTQEGTVCGIDDRVNLHFCDVISYDLERHKWTSCDSCLLSDQTASFFGNRYIFLSSKQICSVRL